MTLQTAEPLPELRLNITSRPVSWLYDLLDLHSTAEFDIDQPYQRGHVWGLERRRNLIRSLIMGVPIASLVINDRGNAGFEYPGYALARNSAYAIVDGKQRATTYAMFGQNLLTIPTSWLPPDAVETPEETTDGLYVRRSGLSLIGRRRFDRHTVGISQGRFQTLDEERMIFNLVNYGGVAQGDTDTDFLIRGDPR